MDDWNSALYLKFERERNRAARDLIAQLPAGDFRTIVDLGCGPGNSAQLLAQAYPKASIVGVDTSAEMLAAARARFPNARFLEQDIRDWRPTEKVDLIFANAALHFLPNHDELFPRLVSYLTAGGCLAAQMPSNLQEVSQALIRMVAADAPWSQRLTPIAKTRPRIGAPEEYYNLLTPFCSGVEIWETNYIHPLDGPDQIVEWFEGSGLRPFLAALDESERQIFLARYRAGLQAAYPRQRDGKALLHYPRLFLVARK